MDADYLRGASTVKLILGLMQDNNPLSTLRVAYHTSRSDMDLLAAEAQSLGCNNAKNSTK